MHYKLITLHEDHIQNLRQCGGHLTHAICRSLLKNVTKVMHESTRFHALGVKKIYLQEFTMSKVASHGMRSVIEHGVFQHCLLHHWAGFVIALDNFEDNFYRYIIAQDMAVVPKSKLPLPHHRDV